MSPSSSSSELIRYPLNAWQKAWDNAQPQISTIAESICLEQAPASRIIRVGQLDAELLDQELVQLLQEPLTKALSLVKPSLKARYEPELTLFLRLTLYKLSVWNVGASYGAKLQGLRYSIPHAYGRIVAASGLPVSTLLMHGALTTLIPYLHTRIRAHALSHSWPDTPASDRRRKAWELLTLLESSHSLLGLLNFIAFLWGGRYRTIPDRLLNLRLVSARRLAKHEVSYEFMNRQMVWHAFTEFLIFLLPLINARALRRRLSSVSAHLISASLLPAPLRSLVGLSSQKASVSAPPRRGKYWALSTDQCAICLENASTNLNLADSTNALTSLAVSAYSTTSDAAASSGSTEDTPPTYPINTPYITSCGHSYCYYCVSERMLRAADERSGAGSGGTRWECLRCGQNVGTVTRQGVYTNIDDSEYWSEEEDLEDGSEDFSMSDFSASVGSYSDSAYSGLSSE